MYEDSWYSFVPHVREKQDDNKIQKSHHPRRESLLKQLNDNGNAETGHTDPLAGLFKESNSVRSPPKATLARRAKSYNDFYNFARAQLIKESKRIKEKDRESMMPAGAVKRGLKVEKMCEVYEDHLLDASQEEFQVYRDQLALSRRHLDSLLKDTSSALDLLANLSSSFKSVEAQTNAFQAQCEDLLVQQKHIKILSEEVGMGLQYYAYLEPITRRLNAPGASSVIGDDGFVSILTNLDACIRFMIKHPEHRESDTYLTRYKSLLVRTLTLVTNAFSRTIKNNAAEAKRTEAERRQATGILTMTSFFLFQDPQTPAESSMQQASLRYLVEQASQDIESSPRENVNAYRDFIAVYERALKSTTQEYIGTRIFAIPDMVEQLLTQTISKEFDPDDDFPRYARECLDATLEICANECVKYLNTFGNNWGLLRYQDQASPIVLGIEKGAFRDYLFMIAMRVFGILQPRLEKMKMSDAVGLATWLNGHVYYPNTSNEPVSLHYYDEGEEATNDIPSQAKSRVAGQMNNKIINTVFNRIRETLVKDVERYLGKSEDFVHGGLSSKLQSGGQSKLGDGLVFKPARLETAVGLGIDGLVIEPTRLEKSLGLGIRGAYPPVKVACELLLYVNDLTFEYNGATVSSEIAYEILHKTFAVVKCGADIVTEKFSHMDGQIFAIKNLIILKNLTLVYDISGSHRGSTLEFNNLWTTFAELRVRGGLFDIVSYYNLLTSGNLLPQVVENVQDARVELDGLLRDNITKFREEGASMVLKVQSSGKRGAMTPEEQIKKKLAAAFPEEEHLQEGLWEAVRLLVDERSRDNEPH